MTTLPPSFIITLDDGAISYNVESHEKKIHAQVGGGNPAIFTYDHKKRLLQSGNYYFGQHLDPKEPSGPQCVYWIQKDAGIPEDAIQKTTIEESNGRYRIKNGGMY